MTAPQGVNGPRRKASRPVKAAFVLLVVLFAYILLQNSLDYDRDDVLNRRGVLAEISVRAGDRDSAFTSTLLSMKSSSGLAVEAAMRTPLDPGRKYPALILLGGKATGKDAIQYVFDMDDAVIVAVDYPYEPRPTYTVATFFEDLPEVRTALLEMLPSVMLVVDHLQTLAMVDTNRIILVGYSFGAPFVPAMSVHDRRIDCAVLVYGGGDLTSLITHNVDRFEGWLFSRLVGTLGGFLLQPIEPLRFIEDVAPTPLVMVNGTLDEQIPRENTESLFASAQEPKVIRWIDSRHVHPRNVELTRTIIGVLKAELDALGMLRNE